MIKPFLWHESLLTEYLPLILSDMKKLSKIKLTKLNEAELSERELNRLLGGENCCICGCHGSSSTGANHDANILGGVSGLVSPGGGWGDGSFA